MTVNSPQPTKSNLFIRRLAAAIVALAFIHSVYVTWNRWGDIIIDCGRELDTPKQILAGKMLYRDIRYWYGPLAPYLNASLYRLFGVSVQTLATAGIVSAALMAWVGYRTVRLFTGRLGAAAAIVALCYSNLFYQCCVYNIFNFALPYSYPASYGILLATGSIYFLLRHVRGGRSTDLFASTLLLGLTALCKVEVLFAAGVGHGVFLLAWLLARRLNKLYYLYGYAMAAALPGIVYGLFYQRVGRSLITDNMFIPGNVAASPFTLSHSGLDHFMDSLKEDSWSGAGMAGLFILGLIAAILEKAFRRWDQAEGRRGRFSLIAPILVTGPLCAALVWQLETIRVFRIMPAVLVFIMGFEIKARDVKHLPALILNAFALAAMLRMGLRTIAEHYGFYLILPGVLAFAVLCCRYLPLAAARIVGSSLSSYGTGIAILASIAWIHAKTTADVSARVYGRDPPPRLVTPQGTMVCQGNYLGSLDEAVRFLQTKPASTKVVVFPEGVGITFLAGCTNALGVHTFLPLDFSGDYSEERMIERLDRAAPDYIVLTTRDVREYGKMGFGLDYAQAVAKWIGTRYKPVQNYRTQFYRVAVLERQ